MKTRKKKHGSRIALLFLALVLLLAGTFSVVAIRDIRGSGAPDKNYVMTVPEGAGTNSVAVILKNRGLIRHPLIFKLYVRMHGAPVYQKGRHTLNPSMDYATLLDRLCTAPDVEEVVRVTVPEGYELRQVVDLLVEKGLGERSVWENEIANGAFDYAFVREIPQRENRLEGYLYPDTYQFSYEESEHQILDRMLKNFADRVLPVYEAAQTDRSLDQIITLSSIIEREAANDEERPLVASVFVNRLAQGMKLESCATVQYILKERKTILSNADTAIDSPYNTYRNLGLPVGPIASPGLSSIQAALNPAATDYLYFVAKADGSGNLFSKTFEEHNQKIQQTQGN